MGWPSFFPPSRPAGVQVGTSSSAERLPPSDVSTKAAVARSWGNERYQHFNDSRGSRIRRARSPSAGRPLSRVSRAFPVAGRDGAARVSSPPFIGTDASIRGAGGERGGASQGVASRHRRQARGRASVALPSGAGDAAKSRSRLFNPPASFSAQPLRPITGNAFQCVRPPQPFPRARHTDEQCRGAAL